MDAETDFKPNPYGGYDVEINLLDNSPTQYSAIISKVAGSDPGPAADFYRPSLRFSDVSHGKWHVNVKKEIDGYWSTVAYWTIDVPEWVEPTDIEYPTPYPTRNTEPLETEKINSSLNSDPTNTDQILFGGIVSLVALAYFGRKLS